MSVGIRARESASQSPGEADSCYPARVGSYLGLTWRVRRPEAAFVSHAVPPQVEVRRYRADHGDDDGDRDKRLPHADTLARTIVAIRVPAGEAASRREVLNAASDATQTRVPADVAARSR